MTKEEFIAEMARRDAEELATIERLLPVLQQTRTDLVAVGVLRPGTADSDINAVGLWDPAEVELAKLHLDQAYWSLYRATVQANLYKARSEALKARQRRCDGTKSIDGGSASERVPCDGRWDVGGVVDGCGEPCAFAMRKQGHGIPPWPEGAR